MMGWSTYICFQATETLVFCFTTASCLCKALMSPGHDFLFMECNAFRGLCGCSGDWANEEVVSEV